MNFEMKDPDFEKVLADGTIIVKPTLYTGKNDWQIIPLMQLQEYVDGLNDDSFKTGAVGLYLQPYVYYYGTPIYMFMLDVENPEEHHRSVQANINTSKKLFYIFNSLNIADDLVIGLSGSSFRFILPSLIPIRYTAAFIEMTNDTHRFPGIDPDIQKGSNKFVRTFAYRGNKSHGHPEMDVHIHYLEDAHDILDLDEAAYKELVKGYPDPDVYRGAVHRILPKGFADGPLASLLEEYNLQVKIKSTIATPCTAAPYASTGTNWDAVYQYLQDSGIEYNEHPINEGGKIIKLDSCPACGEKEGNPFLTENATLKCFRSTKCDAGQGNGLHPGQWIEGYEGCAKTEGVSPPTLTLDEARQQVYDAVEAADRTGEDICIGAAPGVGKTYITLETFVPKALEKRLLYTAPSSKQVESAMETAKAFADKAGLEISMVGITGRNEENCTGLLNVSFAAEMGFTPAYVACPKCSYKKECLYFKQFKSVPAKGMVFTTHDSAMFHEKTIAPDIWIMDENATPQFFRIYKATQKHMDELFEIETGDVRELDDELQDIISRIGKEVSGYKEARIYVGDTPPGDWENATTLENISAGINDHFEHHLLPESFSRFATQRHDFIWENQVYEEKINLNTIKWWDTVIRPSDNAMTYIRITIRKGKPHVEYVVAEYHVPAFENCQVIHLDGTMYEPEIHGTYPMDFEIVDAQVSLQHCTKTFVKSARGKTRMKTLAHEKKADDLEFLLQQLRPEDAKVLLLTHMICEREVLSTCISLRPDIEFEAFHFWGPRGINDYKDFDAVIAYGTPTINPGSMLDAAMMLFDEKKERDEYIESQGIRDLVQAIHRIRPVNGGKNIIVMGSHWPVQYLGEPDRKIDRMRKGDNYKEAKSRLKDFAEQNGFMDKSIALLLCVGTRNDEKALQDVINMLSKHKGGSSIIGLDSYIYTNKSEDQLFGTPPAIFLKNNSAWQNLIKEIHGDTGLPFMLYKPKGAGRKSLAIGTPDSVEAFCKSKGTRFVAAQYEPYLPN